MVAAFLAALVAPRRAQAEHCHECHQKLTGKPGEKARELAGSVHEVIGCAGCHSGDRDDPTVGAHATALGFTARPDRQRISELCGGCHGDARFVRRYNASLPVDQLVLYASSGHGAAVAKGSADAPTCTTCHGTHDITRTDDPASKVHSVRVADMCGECHAKPGASHADDPPRGFGDGVHAAALAAGVPNAPTCTSCHGGHGVLAATTAALAQVCGRCHIEERRKLERSPHARPFRDRGFGECTPCHGSHRIAKPTGLLVGLSADGACGKCHARDPKIRATTERLESLLSETEGIARTAREVLGLTRARGLPTGGLVPIESELKTAELRLRTSVHTLTESELAGPRADVDRLAADLTNRVKGIERVAVIDRRGHYAALGVSGLLFLLLALRTFSRRGAAPRGS